MYRYWGKARPTSASEASYHLLPYHCLDVTAVAAELWERNPLLRASFVRLLGLDEARTRNLLLFLICCHDLGKFADAFQQLNREARAALQPQKKPCTGFELRHDTLGDLFWRIRLGSGAASQLDEDLAEMLEPLAAAVTGHHGLPPVAAGKEQLRRHFTAEDEAAATRFVDAVATLFPLDLAGHRFPMSALPQTSLFLAGLTMICDWAGSHQGSFPYVATPQPLDAYWRTARAQAARMLSEIQLLPPEVVAETGMAWLFPNYRPSPLQAVADAWRPGPGPQLLVIEDLTGAGKTEAAMVLAHALMQGGKAQGLFIGLPTMATADQMYERLEDCYGRFYRDKPLLMLAHGARAANPRFKDQLGLERERAVQASGDGELEAAETLSAHWLADNAKKALLAAIGVGTVDQTLLAVLRKRHAPMRLFGLMGKVLIVDELHAYDAYMQRILETLLDLHTRQGGSTILLSATLTTRQRQAFVTRFQASLGRPASETVSSAYPLFSHVDGAGELREVAVAGTAERKIQVRFVDEAPYALVRALAAAGHCVCWLRNTVTDAVTAYQALSADVDAPDCQLFHARYALVDRLRIQDEVLKRFGKESRGEDRRGRVVVATQVIEQSLDVDFDRMITDLAPVDLLLQRAGRQQRHRRDAAGDPLGDPRQQDARGEQLLTVYGPTWTEAPEQNWYASVFKGGARVYEKREHLLWLTQRALRDWGTVVLPRDARALVDGVYGETDLPVGLQKMELDLEGQFYAHRAKAGNLVYKAENGYEGGIALNADEECNTRLGLDQRTFHLAVWSAGELRPYAALQNPKLEEDPVQVWFQSQIKLPGTWCSGRARGHLVEEQRLVALEKELPGHLCLLPLEAVGDCFKGRLLKGETVLDFIYDPRLGALKPQALKP